MVQKVNGLRFSKFAMHVSVMASVSVLSACSALMPSTKHFDLLEPANKRMDTKPPREFVTPDDLSLIPPGASMDAVLSTLGVPVSKTVRDGKAQWEYVLKKGEGADEGFSSLLIVFDDGKVADMQETGPLADASAAERFRRPVAGRVEPLPVARPQPIYAEPQYAESKIESKAESKFESKVEPKKLEIVETELDKTSSSSSIVKSSDKSEDQVAEAAAINDMLERWVKAWSAGEVKSYLSFYAETFEHGMSSRSAWEKQRRQRLEKSGKIQVSVSDLRINMQSAVLADVRFKQNYVSGHYRDSGNKVMVLSRASGQWKIQSESFDKD